MLLEKKEISPIFEKKKQKNFEKIGIIQLLSFWNKKTRNLWANKFLINSLIKQKDYSTLFELINNNYDFSKSQQIKINKSLNHSFINRHYEDKFSLIKTLEKYNIKISNENYYYLLVSNVFNNTLQDLSKNNISTETKDMCIKVFKLLEDKDFKKEFQEFIVKDIEFRPQDFGAGINWSMNRNIYYEPLKNLHLFNGMTKLQFQRIIKSEIGSEGVLNDFKSLANKAQIDLNTLEKLGINTQTIIEKAQKSLLLKEDSLTNEMKENINNIIKEIENIKKNENDLYSDEYKEEIKKLIDDRLPNVIKKYLSIDEEYRTTLKNIEGKYPSQLLLESLSSIYDRVNQINKSINENKVSNLSIDNRKLKLL